MHAEPLDEVVVDAVERQRDGLQKHQHGHEVVDLEDGMPRLSEQEHPERPRQEEQHRHRAVEGGQRHLAR